MVFSIETDLTACSVSFVDVLQWDVQKVTSIDGDWRRHINWAIWLRKLYKNKSISKEKLHTKKLLINCCWYLLKIAKKLVERALEKDRRRLVRKIQRRSQPGDLDEEGHVIANNYVDVAVNRVLDDLVLTNNNGKSSKKLNRFTLTNIFLHL